MDETFKTLSVASFWLHFAISIACGFIFGVHAFLLGLFMFVLGAFCALAYRNAQVG